MFLPGDTAAASAAFALLHGAGDGVMTAAARGTLPLAVLGLSGYGARQGLIGAPARLLQAVAIFAFGWLLAGAGAAPAVTSGLSLAALAALLTLRRPKNRLKSAT